MNKTHQHFTGCHDRETGRGEGYREHEHRFAQGWFVGRGGFEGRGGRREGFRGGRGGPFRMFGAGDLRYVILQLISEKPSHGYEIIKSIQERLGGTYAPSPGVVYPMLTMLEEMGHATVVVEGARKLYTITEEGSRSLAEQKGMVDAIFARMDRARSEQAAGGGQQIERALANLRMALGLRAGAMSAEQTHAITDILDAAAKQIERVP